MSETTDTPARRIILSRPALVYRADPTHSHGFTIVEVPKGDYPAGVDAVGETLWVTLKNVKGMESDIIGMRKDRWKRMECAKLVGFDESGERVPVEPVADSPPSAAGRPKWSRPAGCYSRGDRVRVTSADKEDPLNVGEILIADRPCGSEHLWCRLARLPDGPKMLVTVDQIEPADRAGQPDAPDRLCGHPLAVSGVVVPEAEDRGQELNRIAYEGIRAEARDGGSAAWEAERERLRAEVDRGEWLCKCAQARCLRLVERVADLEAEVERLKDIITHAIHFASGDANIRIDWGEAGKTLMSLLRGMEDRAEHWAAKAREGEDPSGLFGEPQQAPSADLPDPSIPALQRDYSAEVRADVDRVREIVEERARVTGERIGGTTA